MQEASSFAGFAFLDLRTATDIDGPSTASTGSTASTASTGSTGVLPQACFGRDYGGYVVSKNVYCSWDV